MSTLSLDLRGVEASHELPHEARSKGASISLLVHSIGLATLIVVPLLQTTGLPEVAAAAAPPLPRTILVSLPPAARPQALARRAPKGGRPSQSAAVFPTTPKDTPTTLNLASLLDPTVGPISDLPQVDDQPGSQGGTCPLGSLCGAGSLPVGDPPAALVRIGGSIREPKLRDSRPPVYPSLAQAAGQEGTVVIEAHIGVDGRVKEATITQGHRLFDEAALASVRSRRYDPLLLNGVATEFLLTITVRFSVRR